jgi:hypothetical protein
MEKLGGDYPRGYTGTTTTYSTAYRTVAVVQHLALQTLYTRETLYPSLELYRTTCWNRTNTNTCNPPAVGWYCSIYVVSVLARRLIGRRLLN